MHSVGKGVTSMVVTVLMLALLVFTASRTLDLFQQVLPVSQSIFAYFGLAAIDGGVLGWSYFYAHGARGFQRSIALMMTGLSLIAVAMTTIGDLLIDAGNKGIITSVDEGTRLALLVAIGVMVVINVTAGFLVHITEPERQKSIALEDARAAIHAETLRQIHAATPQVAAQIAPELTAQWVRETAQSIIPGKTIRLASSTDVEEAPWYSSASLPAVRAEAAAKNNHKARGSLQQSH